MNSPRMIFGLPYIFMIESDARAGDTVGGTPTSYHPAYVTGGGLWQRQPEFLLLAYLCYSRIRRIRPRDSFLRQGRGEPLLNGTDVHTEPGLVAGVGRR